MRLADLEVLIIDAQTTGATPQLGRILELAWRIGTAPTETLVMRGSASESLDERDWRRIGRLTGLTKADSDSGVEEAEVFAALQAATATAAPSQAKVAIIHFASFEKRFLDDLWKRHAGIGFPLEIVCTHAVARRLFPQLPSRSLRAVAGFFGATTEDLKRAPGHVEATTLIWEQLRLELARQGVETLAGLSGWLAQKAPRASGPKQFRLERAVRLALPDLPGVYRMLGPSGRVLYVGKATSLRARVNSYFRQRRGLGSPKNELLTQVIGIDATPCATALEAALLETDEIKRLVPPYNVALRERRWPLGFFDRELATVDPESPTARLGPFPTAEALTPLKIVAAALGGDATSKQKLADILYAEIALTTVADGLCLFRQTLPFDAAHATPRMLLAYGAALARAAAVAPDKSADVEEEEEEPNLRDDEREWTPDDVARGLAWILLHAGRALIRSRKIRRLANATVAFRATAAENTAQDWRMLTLVAGTVVGAGWTILPSPTADRATAAQTSVMIADPKAYDRLRVLSTELARVGDARVLATAATCQGFDRTQN